MKNNKGFTLIELMIVIAIIAIIAAIAIPNLMASRIRANEATAIAAIKQIATAQVTYQAGKQGRVGTGAGGTKGGPNGYCDNYRNLAYGCPVGDPTGKLSLVSDVVADASIVADGMTGGTGDSTVNVPGTATAYQGFRFASDVDVVSWGSDFACYAVPEVGATTGNNAYWVGQQGTVYLDGIASTYTAAEYTTGQTPQAGPGTGTWIVM